MPSTLGKKTGVLFIFVFLFWLKLTEVPVGGSMDVSCIYGKPCWC